IYIYYSGVHPREWIAPAAALYLIKKLTESASLTSQIDWYIMPMVNPDGYKYTWENDRFWRKTRSESGTSGCYGVDMNRNFDYHWGSK
ncbi:UNVERIFIED_CONTAM: hypothetical protein GTU68_045553, partial [Idotea baltica]|nr:hypothetical protein [Idotea baltica]